MSFQQAGAIKKTNFVPDVVCQLLSLGHTESYDDGSLLRGQRHFPGLRKKMPLIKHKTRNW